MKVLVLGGTRFVGRAIVERLIQDDSLEISLCNRGQSNTELFTQLPLIKADRLREDFKIDWTSLQDALEDTLSWYEAKGWPDPVAGWSRKKELEFLAEQS